jgi:galactokinase
MFAIGVSGVVADKTGTAKDNYNRASLAVRSILEIWRKASGSTESTLAAAATAEPEAASHIRAALRAAVSDASQQQWLLHRLDQFLLESEVIIPEASDALLNGDLTAFGALVDKSEDAAENLLGNQVPETVWLAKEARAFGAYAASAFGAGFGGSVWALVEKADAEGFLQSWQEAYRHSRHDAARNSFFFSTPAGPPLLQL